MGKTLPTTLPEAPKRGRSRNEALLQARLLAALHRPGNHSYEAMPNLELASAGQMLMPDISLFAIPVKLRRPDVVVVADLPLAVVLILKSAEISGPQVRVAETYLATGINSCWPVEPTLRCVFLANEPANYVAFGRRQTLRDSATGIELEPARLFA